MLTKERLSFVLGPHNVGGQETTAHTRSLRKYVGGFHLITIYSMCSPITTVNDVHELRKPKLKAYIKLAYNLGTV